ncbi:3-deoxy-8-phosphooctulonate synthase [Acidobacteriota bacterium]
MPTDVKNIHINERIKIGGENPLFLIGGPCVLENRDHAFSMAKSINDICLELDIPFIFKASYDKANRSSIKSFRGPGLDEGLQILSEIKQELSIPVLSDVHETVQIQKAAQILDIIQIPAFLSRQTDLIIEAAQTQKPLNIKKGQFLSPDEVINIVEKVTNQGNESIILTERGTSFGYGNLVFDVRSIPIMKEMGFPVVIDASHSVQFPGGKGDASGGDATFIPYVARAGISVGCDGIFCEIHDNPEKALSDKHNSLLLNELRSFLKGLLILRSAVKKINSFE